MLIVEDNPEIKKDILVAATFNMQPCLEYKRFLSFQRITRVICWMKRFCWNAGNADKKKIFLTVQEIEEAETLLFKWIQHEEFGTDLLALTQNQPLSKKSKSLRLTPFLDEKSILKIGGRLSKPEIQSSAKHQLILPVKHHVVQLLIRQYHEISHFDTEYIFSAIRQILWIINGRVSVKQIGRGCMICKQRNARPNESFMSKLPLFRVEQINPPFLRSDVDFFRSTYVKQRRSRVKRLGCIFVCMSVRAVDIELVESLDTDSFINAMQRFINQRGRPSLIASDCGTNIKGAVNEFEIETLTLDLS